MGATENSCKDITQTPLDTSSSLEFNSLRTVQVQWNSGNYIYYTYQMLPLVYNYHIQLVLIELHSLKGGTKENPLLKPAAYLRALWQISCIKEANTEKSAISIQAAGDQQTIPSLNVTSQPTARLKTAKNTRKSRQSSAFPRD